MWWHHPGRFLSLATQKKYRLILESENTTVVDVFRPHEDKPKQTEYWEEGVGEEVEANAAFEGELVQVPRTGLVLNNLQSAKPTFITAETVTASPPRGMSPNLDVLPPRVTVQPETICGQRHLSSDELTDLQQHTKRLCRPRWWAYPLACYVLLKSISFLWNPPTAYLIFQSVAMFLFGIWLVQSLLAMLALQTKLKLDFAEEIVDAQIVGGQSLEILPNSGYVWTIDGEPAKDRRVGKGLTEL